MKCSFIAFLIGLAAIGLCAQSRHYQDYSDSANRTEKISAKPKPESTTSNADDVIKVDTDLVTIPVRISEKNGRPVPDVQQSEFRIVENGIEQQIAYFQNEEQPFTVALLLDMSYSDVFKLHDIQAAADLFVGQLRDQDKV